MIFDQTPEFSRLDAGIQLGPNVMRILDKMGIEDTVERIGC
jgi:6-hydroxynicotinate 3-monooxygenase